MSRRALRRGTPCLPQSNFIEVCEQAATHLGIEWLVLINPADHKRDVYDGKFLGLTPGPKKQFLILLLFSPRVLSL